MSAFWNPKYQWISPGQSVTVNGFTIPDGCVYIGQDLYSVRGGHVDSALIDPRLPVKASQVPQELDYWPSYSDIRPANRHLYLQWLSTGKNNPYVELGYVFMYFYGLERRLLIDQPSSNEAWALMSEIQRLLNIYGLRSYSVRRYLKPLVATTWAYYHRFMFIPDYLDLLDDDSFNAVETLIATCQQYQRPVPAKIALAWAVTLSRGSNRQKLHDPTTRKAVSELFAQRYHQEFGNGAILSPPRHARQLYLDYEPASSSLYGLRPLKIEGALKPSDADHFTQRSLIIFNQVFADIRRHITVLNSPAPTLNRISKLPPELLKQLPATERLHMLLQANPNAHYPLRDIHKAFVPKQPVRIPPREVALLDIILRSLGLRLFPSPERHPHLKLNGDSMVMLVKNEQMTDMELADPHYQLLSLTVKASFLLGLATEQRLIDLFNEGLAKIDLSDSQKTELDNLTRWCSQNIYTISPKELAELDAEQQLLLIKNLASLATQSGHVEKHALSQLGKFARKLKALTDFDLLVLIQKELAGSGPTLVVEANSVSAPSTLTIDHERVSKTLEDTLAAQAALHNVFGDDEDSENELSLSLDDKHQLLLYYLLSADEHDPEEIEQKAKTLGLFADGALETINEWSIAQTEAILIEVDDLVYVDEDTRESLYTIHPTLKGKTDD